MYTSVGCNAYLPAHEIQAPIYSNICARSHITYEPIILNLNQLSQCLVLTIRYLPAELAGMYPFAERLELWVCDLDATLFMIGFCISLLLCCL